MTSPEPIYSAAQTNDGPTRAKTAKPAGGFLIADSFIKPQINTDVVPSAAEGSIKINHRLTQALY